MVRNVILVFVIAVSCVGCDRLTKDIARESLEPGTRHQYMGKLVLLQYEENQGGMLSMGADLSPRLRFWLFTVAVGTVLSGLFLYACFGRQIPLPDRVALALIAGGGIGNLIDRIMYDGYVIDFLNIGVGGLRTAVFNVADVAVFLGAVILVALAMRRMARERR